ncbi:MAG: LysM peptidoglycan-binding domain-containing protein [bacterium]
MFIKGSRYRRLAESTPVDAAGERSRSKDLRLISSTPGRFLHTVHEGDRLDLLAFKYYGDATKWWQICDANPQQAFPVALLDQRPIVEEKLVLTPRDFNTRFAALMAALDVLGTVELAVQDFLASTVTMIYDALPSTRQAILAAIQSHQFHFLQALAWAMATDNLEAFTFDDAAVKSNWQLLVGRLEAMPGMLQVQSLVTETTLLVIYNSAMRPDFREEMLAEIRNSGFDLLPDSVTASRIGAQIIVPPNQIV